jgi:DNA-binding NtrC family response regulator
MQKETQVLLIHQDDQVRHDLSVVLEFLDQGVLAFSSDDWRNEIESKVDSSAEIGLVMLDSGLEIDSIINDIASWDRGMPVLMVGESSKPLQDEVKQRIVAHLELPLNYNKTLDSLYRAQVFREQYSPHSNRTRQRQVQLFRSLVGTSRGVQHVRDLMEQVADKEVSVLITGESGTGKEVVARNLHYNSSRRNKPFVPVNCGAIPAELLESELFGHEKGAFTGAVSARTGLIEAAEGGSLFLDEIGELPAEAQARLLRVLQENEIRRVGSTQSRKVNVRMIAATHRNLKAMTRTGGFREDLYYRLNVMQIRIPPLRERRGDVLGLANRFLKRQSEKMNKPGLNLSPEAMRAMERHRWPGNVRELENAIERATILCDGDVISPSLLDLDSDGGDEHIPETLVEGNNEQTTRDVDSASDLSLEDYFQHFVLENQDRMSETELAQKLGISRKSLWERRQRLGIPRKKAGS